MCTDVNACNCAQGGVWTHVRELHWKLTQGEKSLAAYCHTYKCSVSYHSGSCSPTSAIWVMEFVVSWGWLEGKVTLTQDSSQTFCFSRHILASANGAASSFLARILGRMGFLCFFKVEINSCKPNPLFRPGLVHSGSASWDDCGLVFPDKFHDVWTAA